MTRKSAQDHVGSMTYLADSFVREARIRNQALSSIVARNTRGIKEAFAELNLDVIDPGNGDPLLGRCLSSGGLLHWVPTFGIVLGFLLSLFLAREEGVLTNHGLYLDVARDFPYLGGPLLIAVAVALTGRFFRGVSCSLSEMVVSGAVKVSKSEYAGLVAKSNQVFRNRVAVWTPLLLSVSIMTSIILTYESSGVRTWQFREGGIPTFSGLVAFLVSGFAFYANVFIVVRIVTTTVAVFQFLKMPLSLRVMWSDNSAGLGGLARTYMNLTIVIALLWAIDLLIVVHNRTVMHMPYRHEYNILIVGIYVPLQVMTLCVPWVAIHKKFSEVKAIALGNLSAAYETLAKRLNYSYTGQPLPDRDTLENMECLASMRDRISVLRPWPWKWKDALAFLAGAIAYTISTLSTIQNMSLPSMFESVKNWLQRMSG